MHRRRVKLTEVQIEKKEKYVYSNAYILLPESTVNGRKLQLLCKHGISNQDIDSP